MPIRISTVPYRDNLLKALKDPEEAALYLTTALQDEDPRIFLMALRDVADARGGIRTISQGTRLNRESLYRMLSKAGNPSLDSLIAVLRAVGLKLSVQSPKPKRRPPSAA